MNYIVYDTALNGSYTLMCLQKHYPVHVSLFKGTKDEVLVDVAPFLFLIDDDGEKLKEGIELSLKALVAVDSNQKIDVVAGHFREFIYQKVKGRECYFRFWDARVLKKFLPTCNDIQLNFFFRNINHLAVEGDDATEVIQYRVQNARLMSPRHRSKTGCPFPFYLADSPVATV